MRGAGPNFGVVVTFDFVVDGIDPVGFALLTHQVQDRASFLGRLQRAPRHYDHVPCGAWRLGSFRPDDRRCGGSAERDTIVARLQPFVKLAPLVQRQVVVTPTPG